jgi:hypothetical protein
MGEKAFGPCHPQVININGPQRKLDDEAYRAAIHTVVDKVECTTLTQRHGSCSSQAVIAHAFFPPADSFFISPGKCGSEVKAPRNSVKTVN